MYRQIALPEQYLLLKSKFFVIFFFQNEISKVDKGDKGGISYKSQNIVNQKSRKKKKKWNNTTDKDRKQINAERKKKEIKIQIKNQKVLYGKKIDNECRANNF